MKCPRCHKSDHVVTGEGFLESDGETWSKWRSSIPFTGLIAIGLKHLFGKKARVYICTECEVMWPRD